MSRMLQNNKNIQVMNVHALNINYIIPFSNSNGSVSNNTIREEKDLTEINNIVSNNISNKYKLIKHLGEGIQGNLYLAIDNKTGTSNNNKYIFKKILLDDNNENQLKQIQFELGLLKYLSSNTVTKEHINPCLEHKIIDNNIFTVFPVFDGFSLKYISNYLFQLEINRYYKFVFYLIKSLLHAISKIHQTNIAHQNINENSILISTYSNPNKIYVKFTDFGLGCGYINANKGNCLKIEDYKEDKFFKLISCKNYFNTPIEITKDLLDNLSESEYLNIAQKYDLLYLGLIFIKLLLFFEKFELDLKNQIDYKQIQTIKKYIKSKYLKNKPSMQLFENIDDYKTVLPEYNISNDNKKNILNYLILILDNILCNVKKRNTAQYLLDKLLIYEKYKNEYF
jgi:serine/threonine protein kinase